MAKKIFLSPSNQFANAYAWGGTNEGKQMGLVAQLLKVALERCGFEVMLMHSEDMPTKVAKADKWGADLYIPIHSNACNGLVAGTRMFCWSRTGKGADACRAIFNYLAPITPGESESIKVDQTLYEIRMPVAPVAYIETDFHDVEYVARWIVEHTADIAEAICHGVCDFFKVTYKPAKEPVYVSVRLLQLEEGDKGNCVKTLQILLNKYNSAGLDEDGDFGPATVKAVRAYQKSRGLTADGIVGESTWAKLLK